MPAPLPSLFGFMCVADVKCGPCTSALGRPVRIPQPWAERHARTHETPPPDPVAFAKGFADMAALTYMPPPHGVWSTASW